MVKDVAEALFHELSRVCDVQILGLEQIDFLESSIWNVSLEEIVEVSGLYEISQIGRKTQNFLVIILGSDHLHHVVEDVSNLLHLDLGLVPSVGSRLVLTLETASRILISPGVLLHRQELIPGSREFFLDHLELRVLLLTLKREHPDLVICERVRGKASSGCCCLLSVHLDLPLQSHVLSLLHLSYLLLELCYLSVLRAGRNGASSSLAYSCRTEWSWWCNPLWLWWEHRCVPSWRQGTIVAEWASVVRGNVACKGELKEILVLINERLFRNTELIIDGLNGTLEESDGELLIRRDTLGCQLWHVKLVSERDGAAASTSPDVNLEFKLKNDSDMRMWNVVVNRNRRIGLEHTEDVGILKRGRLLNRDLAPTIMALDPKSSLLYVDRVWLLVNVTRLIDHSLGVHFGEDQDQLIF